MILGSSSPRRVEIMGYFALPFSQVSPPFDEDSLPFRGEPEAYVVALAQGKAESIESEDLILTADTIVYREGKVYGKPRDQEHAFKMLSELVGQWHTVYTGVYARQGEKSARAVSQTRVLFEDLSPDQIRRYQRHVDGSDKAGGYAIQGAGSLIVNRIEGCYTNVLGLPVQEVAQVLEKMGVNIWEKLG
jgi:septum formation protein